jgi:hypothetical protein
VREADILDRPARVLVGVADFRPGFGGGRGHAVGFRFSPPHPEEPKAGVSKDGDECNVARHGRANAHARHRTDVPAIHVLLILIWEVWAFATRAESRCQGIYSHTMKCFRVLPIVGNRRYPRALAVGGLNAIDQILRSEFSVC